MTWTIAMPTETGWYWYKGEDPDKEFHADGIAIVEVVKQ